jgi:hypothetical protein
VPPPAGFRPLTNVSRPGLAVAAIRSIAKSSVGSARRRKRFADAVEGLPTSREPPRREQQLVAEYARSIGFVPSADDRIGFRGDPTDATLDILGGGLDAAAPEWRRRRGVNWAALVPGARLLRRRRLAGRGRGDPRSDGSRGRAKRGRVRARSRARRSRRPARHRSAGPASRRARPRSPCGRGPA